MYIQIQILGWHLVAPFVYMGVGWALGYIYFMLCDGANDSASTTDITDLIKGTFFLIYFSFVSFFFFAVEKMSSAKGWTLRKKGKKQKLFLVLNPRPGLDGPNASGWYRRLRQPISPSSLLNCDQLRQLFSRV